LRYGWHGFYTLQSLLYDYQLSLAWESYVADCLSAITTRLFRWSGAEDFEMPLFSELINKKSVPKLTTGEIKENIVSRLLQ
jgi:hypothetical protein